MNPIVNKWLDLLDRAGWTGVQAAAGALALYLSGVGVITWKGALIVVGVAVLGAIAKVTVGQNTGGDDTGALIGTAVIEPPPEA
jgi:flagellar basal body rod protein FlgF